MKKSDKEILSEHKQGMFLGTDDVARKRYEKINELIKPNSRVLDVGCSRKQMKSFISGYYVGIDIGGDPDIVGSCYNLPFKNKSFDYVILSEVIEHLERPFDAIREAKRVGKKIIVTTPNPYAFTKLIGYVTKLADKEPLTHYISYNSHNLKNIFRVCGLKVDTYIPYGFKIPKWKLLPIKSRYGGIHIFVTSEK